MMRYLLPLMLLAIPALAQDAPQDNTQQYAIKAAVRCTIEKEQLYEQIEKLHAELAKLQAPAK